MDHKDILLARDPAKSILLVDDEPAVFTILAARLRALGYLVDLVTNAADAWRCLGAQRYTFVITDWQLGDGDGIKIADAAANLGSKTVVISGYDLGSLANRHLRLSKPISLSELYALIEQNVETNTSNSRPLSS